MRNYSESCVSSLTVFESSYETALAWARSEQRKAPANVSYTIDRDNERGIITKHEGHLGGNPPYQEIIHKSIPDTTIID